MLFSSCDSRPNGVLNQKEMTNVLTEMHKTDATLNETGLTYKHYSDKAPYYKFIFKKYGITQANFDSSLVWYSKNPRVFGNIYEKVLANLTSLQKEVKNGKYHPVDTLDITKMKTFIWNKRTKYLLTKDSTRTHLNFEIPNNNFMYKDAYILKFLQRIAPVDSCTKQRIVLRINYANGKADSITSIAYHDSILRRYTIRLLAVRKLKIKSISGELLGSKTYKGKMNSLTDSISLMREYNSKIQDSLRKVVDMASPGYKPVPINTTNELQRNNKKFINRRFYHPL
ncbi:MAG: DUF4296 domain-containing protein [Paludibacter sp.]|nr:DUF4296 domain-containing protein [Paludibacter sp.]